MNIKKILPFFICLMASPISMAEWKLVGTNPSGNIYADTVSKEKTGKIAKMWELYDAKIPINSLEGQWLSYVAQYEYDCVSKTSRSLSMVFYAGNMQQGSVISNVTSPNSSTPVVPNTMEDGLLKVACGKK